MPDTILRRAVLDDAETLADIGRRTFIETFGHLYPPQDLAAYLDEAYDLNRVRRDLSDPQSAVWLVERDGQAVGHALAGPCGLPHPQVTPACGELKRLYLLKACQNGGLGARLFAQTLDWLQRDGPRSLWIGVWSENHGAQRFYARAGFQKVGEYGFPVGQTMDLEFILRRPG